MKQPDHIIVFDTETTGLTLPKTAPLANQPHIIELAAIKLNWETLEEVDRIEFLCKPPVPITAVITNITKITQDMLKDKAPFISHLKDLQEFFFGVQRMAAHNITFDRDLLFFELERVQKVREFPWPMEHICTVERSFDIHGRRMKQGDLYKHLTGKELVGAHRAMADVEGLIEIIRELRKQGRI